jgi:hypothetical protein
VTYDARDTTPHVVPEALKISVLELQASGLTSGEVGRRLGIPSIMARNIAKREKSPFGSLQAYKRAALAPPASAELVCAFNDTPVGRCTYIEADLHDPAARPCGEPCCTVEVNGSKRRSAWCGMHHLVVYPEVVQGVRRAVNSKMNGLDSFSKQFVGGTGAKNWRRK